MSRRSLPELAKAGDEAPSPRRRGWVHIGMDPARWYADRRHTLVLLLSSVLDERPTTDVVRAVDQLSTDLPAFGLKAGVDRFVDALLPADCIPEFRLPMAKGASTTSEARPSNALRSDNESMTLDMSGTGRSASDDVRSEIEMPVDAAEGTVVHLVLGEAGQGRSFVSWVAAAHASAASAVRHAADLNALAQQTRAAGMGIDRMAAVHYMCRADPRLHTAMAAAAEHAPVEPTFQAERLLDPGTRYRVEALG